MKNRLTTGLVLCTSLLLMACNLAEYDWYKATSANTLIAYQAFVREHPGDKHADEARGRILALQDDADWNTAKNLNTIAGFQDYLQKESGGVHVLEAQAAAFFAGCFRDGTNRSSRRCSRAAAIRRIRSRKYAATS